MISLTPQHQQYLVRLVKESKVAVELFSLNASLIKSQLNKPKTQISLIHKTLITNPFLQTT